MVPGISGPFGTKRGPCAGALARAIQGQQTMAAPAKERFFMKYIAMILDSIRGRAAVQTRLEDACVGRWGFCLDAQH